MNSLPCNLEVIDFIRSKENLAFCLARFRNLKKLHYSIEADLTDNFIKEITKCQKIEDLTIIFWNYKLTAEGESCFSKLKQLKSINLLGDDKNLSHLLLTLRNCKDLEYIEIYGIGGKKFVYALTPKVSIYSNQYNIKRDEADQY